MKRSELKIKSLEKKLKQEKLKKERQVERLKRQVAKKKRVPISKLKKKLDKVFSMFIRKRDDGVCFTCGVKKPIAEMQNGHFCSRRYLATRWDERNCNTQCVSCNVFLKGNMDIYAHNLMGKYGSSIVEELVKESRALKKFSREEIELMIEKYS